MAADPVLNRQLVSTLLGPNPFAMEEESHTWHTDRFQPFNRPLLRLWDNKSGSQPNEKNVMMSRAPDQFLNTYESRKTSLTTHLYHRDWEPTPYISFTSSAAKIQELAELRFKKRGDQILTMIDPDVRLKNGLPVLIVAEEMDHYYMFDPYRKAHKFHKDHYVCLWQVTANEVVGHWRWNDLIPHKNWYQTLVLPAFRHFRKKMVASSPQDHLFGLEAALNQPSR